MLAGMIARPRAISLRTNSGVMKAGIFGAEAFAVGHAVFRAVDHLRAAHVLAMGDVDHFLCNDSGAANSYWVTICPGAPP